MPPARKRHHKRAPLQLAALSNAVSSADTVSSLAGQEAGEGSSRQWVGLSGADDPYCAPPPSDASSLSIAVQKNRTQKARDFRSYFKVRTIILRYWIR